MVDAGNGEREKLKTKICTRTGLLSISIEMKMVGVCRMLP